IEKRAPAASAECRVRACDGARNSERLAESLPSHAADAECSTLANPRPRVRERMEIPRDAAAARGRLTPRGAPPRLHPGSSRFPKRKRLRHLTYAGGRMPVLGVGVDMVKVERLVEALERFGARMEHRLFTEGELTHSRSHRDPLPHLAAPF